MSSCLLKSYKTKSYEVRFAGTDPRFSEREFEQSSTNMIYLLFIFDKSFFHKKKCGKNIFLSP